MKKNKKIILFILLTVLNIFMILTYFYKNFYIIKVNNNNNSTTIGIIDGSLSSDYIKNKDSLNINYLANTTKKSITHGDNLIKFTLKYNTNIKIYYYDATNNNGVINTESVLSGLKWMKKNKITKINISMSSNIYSDEFQNLINNNINEFQVYASYNNLTQSVDYPAMYENVIGCGKNTEITFKPDDITYKSNKIFVFKNILNFNYYNGNSYLSLLSLLES